MVGAGLAASLTELLAATAIDGYAEGCAKFDPAKGWDRRLFGLTVWTSTAHALQGHVEELKDERVRLLRPNGSVVLRVHGHPSTIEVGFRRQDADGDLELDPFGGSATKDWFTAAGAEQLSLIDVERLPHLRPTVMLAAGHDGTPTDGLTAITIGQPKPQMGGAARWVWRERLWSPLTIGHGAPGVAALAGLASGEGPEVTVTLKRPAAVEPAG
jgi:hypothetical protein